MRTIQHDGKEIKRGKAASMDGGGDLHFVDANGSYSLVGGVLYHDGQPVTGRSQRRIILDDRNEDLVIDINTKGMAKHRAEPRGGGRNG